MTKKEQKKFKILSFLSAVPIVSTSQVGLFFLEHGSPNKRASELLKELEKDKWIEGRSREMGKSKIWRLTKLGREQFEIKKRPVPLTYRNIEHVLEIGNLYLDLLGTGKLQKFECELRRVSNEVKYCPDAFFQAGEKRFYVEVQRSLLSKTNWNEKWKVAKKYFKDKHDVPIIALTNQKEETVRFGSDGLSLIVTDDIKKVI